MYYENDLSSNNTNRIINWRCDQMDIQLKELYRDLLSIRMKDGKTIFYRIAPDDLCLAGHHVGRSVSYTHLTLPTNREV